jgi:DNA-binding transcriptional LysR family regulator
VHIAKQRYPNLEVCFVSSRTYGGYATTAANPEPYAYESGFAVQWLPGQQMAGDHALNCDPALGPVTAPWLGAGPYLWTDGVLPRSDGLTWTCADVQADGLHPSPAGRDKVVGLLQAFFTNDAIAAPWYLVPAHAAAVAQFGAGCAGVGGVATLSRNFLDNFLRPLLHGDDVRLSVTSDTLRELLGQLRVHSLDVVLANQCAVATSEDPWRCRRIARQPVSLVGHPGPRRRPFLFPQGLDGAALVLPTQETESRAAFDVMCRRLAVRYTLRAEADDMALLRLLARDSDCMALLPTIVVQDELRSGQLIELCEVPHLHEYFYAITAPRRFMPQAIKTLLARPEDAALARR